MKYIHEYLTVSKGQVPQECENHKADNEGFFLISMSVINRNTGRKKCTQFKGRQTVCMAWRIERQEQGHQFCHQEQVQGFQQLASQTTS